MNFLGYINKVYIKRDSELGRVNELGNYLLERGSVLLSLCEKFFQYVYNIIYLEGFFLIFTFSILVSIEKKKKKRIPFTDNLNYLPERINRRQG